MHPILLKLLWLMTGFVYLAGRLLYKLKVEGLENLPKSGPYILIFNECGFAGSTFTSMVLSRLIMSGRMEKPTGWSFEDTWQHPAWRWIFRRSDIGLIPAGRGQAVPVMLEGYRALNAGRVLVINPDGSISLDGRIPPLKTGTAWLALRTGVPLVPLVANKAAYAVWPLWAARPRLSGRITVTMGKPFYVSDGPRDRVTPGMIEEANRTILEHMSDLYYRS